MASLRQIKKDIEYLVNEVVSDSYMALYINPDKKDDIVEIIKQAVDARNEFIATANHPAEKHNRSLVRKHYAVLRRDMLARVDDLFERLCSIVNGK